MVTRIPRIVIGMARTVASIVRIVIRRLRRVSGMMKIVTWMVSIIRKMSLSKA